MIPAPSAPWLEAKRIVGLTGQLSPAESARADQVLYRTEGVVYNDFCLIADQIGRWHCVGIAHRAPNGEAPTLFHAVSDMINGEYEMLDPIGSGTHEATGVQMWSPFIIWRNDHSALLYYSHQSRNTSRPTNNVSIRILESNDPRLEVWSPLRNHGLAHGNALFAEKLARDPCIFWDSELRNYLMYYVVGSGWEDPEREAVVRLRQSSDLLYWSEPTTVMVPPPGYRAAESVFVMQRGGLYYLWVCGYDYGRMSLYVSNTPFHFGDPLEDRVAEQSGHAPEVVRADGQDWIACCAVASRFGNSPAQHDLPGVYIQPLIWDDTSSMVTD